MAAQYAAIKNNSFGIRYVKDPAPEVQVAAIRKQPMVLGDALKKPCPEAIQVAVELIGASKVVKCLIDFEARAYITKKLAHESLKDRPRLVLMYFRHLDDEEQWMAFRADPECYHEIGKRSEIAPSITDAYQHYIRKQNRYPAPLIGKRRLGAFDYNQDQLKLVRWFDQTGRDKISVKELKQQPWGNTPYFMELFKKVGGRDITLADMKSQSADPIAKATRSLVATAVLEFNRWDGGQIFFKTSQNIVAVLHTNGKYLRTFVDETQSPKEMTDDSPQVMTMSDLTAAQKLNQVASQRGHPLAPTKRSTGKRSLFNHEYDFDNKIETKLKDDRRYTLGWSPFYSIWFQHLD